MKKTVSTADWKNNEGTIDAEKGEHLYIKVRTYVKNSTGTFYSDFSNVLELNNAN